MEDKIDFDVISHYSFSICGCTLHDKCGHCLHKLCIANKKRFGKYAPQIDRIARMLMLLMRVSRRVNSGEDRRTRKSATNRPAGNAVEENVRGFEKSDRTVKRITVVWAQKAIHQMPNFHTNKMGLRRSLRKNENFVNWFPIFLFFIRFLRYFVCKYSVF